MNKVYTFLYWFFLFTILLSCKEKTLITVYENGNIKEMKTFYGRSDTTNYQYQSFFTNGVLRKEGLVLNGKNDGLWKYYYADGYVRSKITYKEGKPDLSIKEKKYVILNTDSLKIGQSTFIKIINRYPEEGISCRNTKLTFLTDNSYFDAVITPETIDSIYLYYSNHSPDRSKDDYEVIDSVVLKNSGIDNPAEYGLNDEQLQEYKEIISITTAAKYHLIEALPVYP